VSDSVTRGGDGSQSGSDHHDQRCGRALSSYVPEQNPFIDDLTGLYGIPRDATSGHQIVADGSEPIEVICHETSRL
jgi:hypothetical protein